MTGFDARWRRLAAAARRAPSAPPPAPDGLPFLVTRALATHPALRRGRAMLGAAALLACYIIAIPLAVPAVTSLDELAAARLDLAVVPRPPALPSPPIPALPPVPHPPAAPHLADMVRAMTALETTP